MSPARDPVEGSPAVAPRRNRRRWLARFALSAAATLVALKLADVGVGWARNTRERHLLRLVPHSTLRHRSHEFDYEFRTNILGLRGPDVPFEKPSGVRRIVVLGDSFVAGYGVAEDDLLTVKLQALTNEAASNGSATSGGAAPFVEVVNSGRVGTSTIREYDIYEDIGRRFHPDVVILMYYLGNDLAEIMQEQSRAELVSWHPQGALRRAAYFCFPNLYLELAIARQSRRQLREFAARDTTEVERDLRQESIARGRDPERAVAAYAALPAKIRADVSSGMLAEQRIIDSCIEPDRLVRALDPDEAVFAEAWRRTQEHLELLHQAATRDGARFVLVAIPAPFQISRESLAFHSRIGYEVRDEWLERPPRIARALEEWSRRARVPYLDLTTACRASKARLYFTEDVHFTPAGHSLAAEVICNFLRERGER